MQGRAVAVYVALFLVIGAAAGTLIATADSPEVSFDDPDFTLSEGEEFEVGGQTYVVAEVSEDDDGVRSGTVEWEEIAEQTAAWDADSVVTVDDREWRVVIEGEEPDEFVLREEIDRQAILEDDPSADNETVTRNDEEYVVIEDEDGETTLVHVDDYFPAPEERTHTAGDALDYDGQQVTVESITADEVTVGWEGPLTLDEGLIEGERVTFGDTEYVAHFPDGNTLVLSSNIEAYEQQLAAVDTFDQRVYGLQWTVGLSLLAAIFVAGLAFIPSRY